MATRISDAPCKERGKPLVEKIVEELPQPAGRFCANEKCKLYQVPQTGQ